MTVFQSIVLGLIQGIAEFLPISSSGHLAVAQTLFHLDDVPLLFDVFLHLATLVATVVFFRKKIIRFFAILFRWILRRPVTVDGEVSGDGLSGSDVVGRKTIVAVLVVTFVTGVIGVCTSKLIPELPISFVCGGFICTGVLLLISARLAKRQPSTNCGISLKQSLCIGLAQGIGTLPGISRSGSTIAGALAVNVKREDAGEFSFIVSIPAILGAFVLELKDLSDVTSSVGVLPVVCGCLTACVSGYVALSWLMKLIKKGQLAWFAAYLIPVGVIGLIIL
ncbi:MAG: undecaprenyl-diphosphate phosphatase [Treponema sp.]|nr:undecaprenyl-diphosphate phosphatase [Treponema sp.]